METFVSDLKASVAEAKQAPEGKGTMMALYGTSRWRRVSRLFVTALTASACVTGLGSSSAVGPTIVEEVASIFLDTLYKA